MHGAVLKPQAGLKHAMGCWPQKYWVTPFFKVQVPSFPFQLVLEGDGREGAQQPGSFFKLISDQMSVGERTSWSVARHKPPKLSFSNE